MYELQVPVNRLQYRINEDCVLGHWVCQEVGVGAALRLKQLNRGGKKRQVRQQV